MFYLLSLMTGILECGWLMNGVAHSMPIWQSLCYPLAYHIGNLFPKPFTLPRWALQGMCLVSAGITIFAMLSPLTGTLYFILTCLRLTLLSAVFQSVRGELKQDGNRLLKRIARVGGFALSLLAIKYPEYILLLSTIIANVALMKYQQKGHITGMKWQGGYSAVMLFHQLHYFCYAHITLAAATMYMVSLSEFPTRDLFIGLLVFCGTWVTYMAVEPIVSRLTDKVLSVFFIGHIAIAVLLLTMSQLALGPVFVVFWLLTGFGGGTVYTISRKAKNAGKYHSPSMTIAENIGHTLGLVTAVVIAVFLGDAAPTVMLVLGAVSALLAVCCMLLVVRKEKNNETHSNKR